MRTTACAAGWVLALLFCCCACSPQRAQVAAEPPAQPPLLHAVYSDQLKSIMSRMNNLVFERELTALQIEELRAESLENLVSTVRELVLTAREMQETSPGTALATEDRITFEAMARQLLSTAETLGEEAQRADLTGMDLTFRRLNETCDTCHRLFRR